MAQPIMSLDVITDTAYRAAPKFDTARLRTPPTAGRPLQALVRASSNGEGDNYATVGLYNPELSEFVSPTSEAVTMLARSDAWLKQFGLEANHLDARSIARRLGFKHAKNFDNILRKEISSIYGENLFCRFMQIDGKEYNITATKEELKQAIAGLSKLMDIFRKRLDWLTHGSRKLFGLVLERRVTILVDFQILSVLEFEQFCLAFERFIKEQLSRVERFNVIRCDEDPLNCYSSETVPANVDNIDAAIQWLHNWRRVAIVPQVKSINVSNFTSHSVVDGFVKAVSDRSNQAVYLLSNGVTVECCKELLRDRVHHAHMPVHVAAFNCNNSSMLQYFGELCTASGGRLHAYRVTMQFALYEALPYSEEQHTAPVGKREYVCGSASHASGAESARLNVSSTRDDVVAVFAENENAKELCKQIQTVLQVVEEREQALRKNVCEPKLPPGAEKRPSAELLENQQDEYMNSAVWLLHHGVKARRLDFYDFLRNLVFRHVDGIMEQCYSPIKSRFELAMQQDQQQEPGANARAESLDLSTKRKSRSAVCVEHTSRLVNAQYCCELFAHIRWPTGELMHVQVSPEVYRLYEERMLICMNAMERRLNWLKRGSRAVFGTIVEDHVYLLIDTSESMLPHMQFLKDRIYLLLQEQLRHKKSLNIIAYNTEVIKWKPSMQPINESTLQEAWRFVKSLDAYGTTNTQEALRAALLDKAPVQAFYLLTDGRPDMPKAMVLEEIESYKFFRATPGSPAKERQIPRIHSISFNCEDYEANLFLRDLAKLTGGRFHSFHVSEEEQRKRIASRYPLKLKKSDGVFEFSSFAHVDYENPVYDGDDIGLLERELSLGRTYLFRLQELRDQCASKQEKAQRGRQERVAKLDETRRQADRHRKLDTEQRRDLLQRNRLVGTTSASHARLVAAMRDRMSKVDSDSDSDSDSQHETPPQPSFPDWMLPETKAYLVKSRTPRGQWKRKQAKERKLAKKQEKTEELEPLEKDIPPCPVAVSPELARKVGEQIARQRQQEARDSELHAADAQSPVFTGEFPPSIARWLRKHGLQARKLTLYDVLRPTFVTHTHKYVPILRKFIHGKVYRDIMPFGYVPAHSALDLDQQHLRELSGDESRSRSRTRSASAHERVIRLINPLAVDLKKYMAELDLFIPRATTLLNRCVWKALTDSQRTEICGLPGSPTPSTSDQPAPQQAASDKPEAQATEEAGQPENTPQTPPKSQPRKVLPADAEHSFSFAAHRAECLKALEDNDWPINSKKTIEQLEQEITVATRCLEQAREIHLACNEEIRQRKQQQTQPDAAAAGQKLKSAKSARSDAEHRQTEKSQHASAANSFSVAESDERNGNDDSLNQQQDAENSAEETPELKKDQIVIARNSEDGLFYHAFIRQKVDGRSFRVEFSNPNLSFKNRMQTMDKLYIKAVEVKKTATAKGKKKPVDTLKASAFKPGIPVLVRALNSDTSEFCYVPGVVVRLLDKVAPKKAKQTKSNPIRDTTQDKNESEFMCEMVLYNSQSCKSRLKNLVIIKHGLYHAARDYLLDLDRKKKSKKSDRKKEKDRRPSTAVSASTTSTRTRNSENGSGKADQLRPGADSSDEGSDDVSLSTADR